MKLLTKSITEQLLRSGKIRNALDEQGETDPDILPVVKLFTPELGSVRISELESVRGWLGLPVQFVPGQSEQLALF